MINSKIKQGIFDSGSNLNDSLESDILKAIKECRRIAAENGISDMGLEEINEVIANIRGFHII